jgi:very-short-patch-repair endonuclease
MGTFTKPASDYAELPVVVEHIERAGETFGMYHRDDFINEMQTRLSSDYPGWGELALEFDSPLEALFWIWWSMLMRWCVLERDVVRLDRHVFVKAGSDEVVYNLDFVVASRKNEPAWPLVGIELDGHAFHEKTREQVTYRNQRDRALQFSGWKIFHFSWDEFTKDPENSVFEVVLFIRTHRSRAAQAALRAE